MKYHYVSMFCLTAFTFAGLFVTAHNDSIGFTPIFIDMRSNLAVGLSGQNKRLPSNTVLTVVVSGNNKLYLGKYSTIGRRGQLGREDIVVSEAPKGFTFTDFEKYIATTP